MRRTKEETERTRLSLLDAAEALFWEKGAARTSVIDIARKAGLTRGAFYYHFRDKPAVFEAMIARARSLEKSLPALDGDEDDPLMVLRTFCKAVFDHFAQDRYQQRVFGIVMHRRETLGELESLAQQRRDEICRSSLSYQRLLEQARSAGRLSPGWTPSIGAATLYSMILGLLDQWLRAPEKFDVRTLGHACIDQLFDSFEAVGSGRMAR